MREPSRFKVNGADLDGPTWVRLERHIRARLEELREENDMPTLDERKTAHLRGRITELKLLLQAAEKDPPPLEIQ